MSQPAFQPNGRIVGEIGTPTGRAPSGLAPAAPEAEEAVLGACLIGHAVPPSVVALLRPEHFSRSQFAALFEVMLAMTAAGAPLDMVTLQAELERLGLLDEVGGMGAVAALVECAPWASHARHYAEVVRRRAAERGMIAAAGQIARMAYDGEDKALAKAQAILAQLDYDLEAAETGELADALADLRAPRPTGWSTGIQVIDQWLGNVGLVPGRSLVITGIPGIGKTTFMTAMELAALRQGANVVDFSTEMTRAERVVKFGGPLLGRSVARLIEVPSDLWLPGDHATYEQIEAALASLPGRLWIYQDQQDPLHISTIARRHGADVVGVDFYQRLLFSRERGETSDEVDKRNAEALALSLPKAAQACVIIASQLNKDGTMKYGSWLNAFAHAHLHMGLVPDTANIRVEPKKNRWGVNSTAGVSADFEADLAVGRFTHTWQGRGLLPAAEPVEVYDPAIPF